jgi:hypothetical protein
MSKLAIFATAPIIWPQIAQIEPNSNFHPNNHNKGEGEVDMDSKEEVVLHHRQK